MNEGYRQSLNIKISNWALVLFFILIIGIVPAIQLVNELRLHKPIQELDLFRSVPTADSLSDYQNTLAEKSIVAQTIRPWYQLLSTRVAGQGNAKSVIGRDGWLFYRPSVDFIVQPGPSFDRELGPHPAIVSFNETLKAQGVDLILLPIPGKATIYPEYLSRRYNTDLGPPVNPRTPEFYRTLRDKGIRVLDPADLLWKAKSGQAEWLYMPQDTHWSPSGMKLVAQFVAEAVEAGGWLEGVPLKKLSTRSVEVTRLGDICDMLNFPEGREPYSSTKITVEEVIDAQTGEAYTPDTNSPIVLLGDSFVNVFSQNDMKWGEHAGFAEHLAHQLSVPIDVIAINDGGPTGSRQSLARRANALAGKKLVIWQFPTRDLVNPESEWRTVEIPRPSAPTPPSPLTPSTPGIDIVEKKLIIAGEVMIVSNVPDPSEVAYPECVTFIKYRVIDVEQGEYEDEELLAVHWGMKDSALMPAARFQVGEKHRLSLDAFGNYPELSHIMQADDTDDYEHTPFWVLEMSSFTGE